MEGILQVIKVSRVRHDDWPVTEVRAGLEMGVLICVPDSATEPGTMEYAEESAVRTLVRALYGGIEARLREVGPLAIASAKNDADAMRIARGFQEVLDLIGSKRDVMQSMVVRVVDEGVGYPELYFNENRGMFTTEGEMT